MKQMQHKCIDFVIIPVQWSAFVVKLVSYLLHIMGRVVAQCLKRYATNQQVAGSIPDRVIEIFQWHNPSSHTVALGSTQPLTEMSTRCIPWG